MTSKGREPVFFFFDIEAANSSVGADIIQFGVTCDPSVHLMAEFSAFVKTKQKLSPFSKFFFNRANGGSTCVSSYIAYRSKRPLVKTSPGQNVPPFWGDVSTMSKRPRSKRPPFHKSKRPP